MAQSIYTDDTGDTSSPQNLAVALAFNGDGSGPYECDAGSLASSAIYYAGEVTAFLSAIPGFGWVGEIGELVATADAGTEAGLNALSLSCEIQTLEQGG